MSEDYKSTVFLPKTSFSMKAGLPEKEPEILKQWESDGLYKKIRNQSKGKKKFILHDGPPFANGSPHAGTAFNRIIKDIVVKFKQMQGYDAPFVPGWDCHGLPIEWKVEENLRKEKKSKEDIGTVPFRQMCRDFANYWIDVQRTVFKRLGSLADWDSPYLTMDAKNESNMIRGFGKLLSSGALYRGQRPVLWSVVEKTALAEAEVEYKDKKSSSIYVAFNIKSAPSDDLLHAACVIWTTTPWTLPSNRAISFSKDIDYVLMSCSGCVEDSDREFIVIVANDLKDAFLNDVGCISHKVIRKVESEEIDKIICRHPFHGKGFDFDVPMLDGKHVTTEAGTGFVHTAPAHGVDDFYICQKHNIEVVQTVNEGGCYCDNVPLFAGKHIFKIDPEILEYLREVGSLLCAKEIVHSYPHSWRSKAPLIYRTTKQWFISLDKTNLRQQALTAIENVRWLPEQGYNRIKSFVSTRGDWCISRQRSWGVPLPIFVHKKTEEALIDENVIERIATIVEKEGTDAWFTRPAGDFLGDEYPESDYVKVFDIVDVWLESGSTHSYVLDKRDELNWPADLYLEGSDQHRGWFQAALLHSCATKGSAPYKTVLTHGFVLDERGYKMSKSLGNVVDPMDIVNKSGADIMRLWAVNNEYTEDMKFGHSIIKQQEDVYRRLRNTLRYMLGVLDDYKEETELTAYDQFSKLDKWILSRLSQVDKFIEKQIETFSLNKVIVEIHNFCSAELSAFYFDIMKDCLYCDSPNSIKRRAYRTVVSIIFNRLIKWLAPIISFTAEEAWQTRHPNTESIHLQLFDEFPAVWSSWGDEELWGFVKLIRSCVTSEIEKSREKKLIGSSLQASVVIYDPDEDIGKISFSDEQWSEIFITSGVKILNSAPLGEAVKISDDRNIWIEVLPAQGTKCQRCWRVLPEVSEKESLCQRCLEVVSQ